MLFPENMTNKTILVPVGCYSQMAEANDTQTITQTFYKGKYSAQRVYMTFGSGGVVREGFPLEVKKFHLYKANE